MTRSLSHALDSLLAEAYRAAGDAFRSVDRLTGYRIERFRFRRKNGYPLDLAVPQSLNQKITWKKIHDRNPLLPVATDKLRVREYVRSILGDEEADRILIPVLFSGTEPRDIPFDSLPEEYVIKTNHGSGMVIVVRAGEPFDRKKTERKLRRWLRMTWGAFTHQWAYLSIPKRVLVEPLLLDEDGNLPRDFKFHMFNGACRFIQVFYPSGDNSRSAFDAEWRFLDIGSRGLWRDGQEMPPPENLPEMLRIAERLARDFEYVRVDLYSIGKRIYFGELTAYPSNGGNAIDPVSMDFKLGSYWDIVLGYWLRSAAPDSVS